MSDLERCKTDDRRTECVTCQWARPHVAAGGEPECYSPTEWYVTVGCGVCKWRVHGICAKTGSQAPHEAWVGCPMMEVR